MGPLAVTLLSLWAAVTAAISATFGLVGGMLLLIAMAAVLPLAVVIPLHGAIQLVSNVSRAFALRREIVWQVSLWQIGPGALGAVLAGFVLLEAGGAKGDFAFLKPVVGWTAIGSLVLQKLNPKLRDVPGWGYAVMGLLSGFAAPVIGAIGPIVAPFCNRTGWSRQQTIATIAVVQVYNHVVKIAVWVLMLGFAAGDWPDLLLPMALATIAGTWAGATLLKRLPERVFRALFELGLAVAGLWLVLSPWVQLG